MFSRALICASLIAAGIIAAVNSTAPADSGTHSRPAACSLALSGEPSKHAETKL